MTTLVLLILTSVAPAGTAAARHLPAPQAGSGRDGTGASSLATTGSAVLAPAPPPAAARPSAAGPTIASWPTYLGNAARDSAQLDEPTLSTSNISRLGLRWSMNLNGSMSSSAAYVNGTVYFGDWNGYEYALNAGNGTLKWATFLGKSSSCYVSGIDSSPTIWNDTLYVGAGNDHWDALNASTGQVEWKVSVAETGNFDWASPLVYRGALYIGIASCSDSPLVQGKLLMVNLSGNHSVLHTFYAVPNGNVGATIWASPMLDATNNTVWVATGNDNGVAIKYDQSLVALNASTLAVRGYWQVPDVAGTDSDFGATPTLIHDGTGRQLIVDTNKNGVVYALNTSNVTSNGSWNPVWSVNLGPGWLYSPGAFDGSTLYESGSSVTLHGTAYTSSLRAIDPSNGTVRWTQGTQNSPILGAVAYANGLLIDPAGTVLEVRDASTGTLLTSYKVPDPKSAGLMMQGSPIVVAGQIIFGSGNEASAGGLYDLGIPMYNASLVTPASYEDAPYAANFSVRASGGLPPYSVQWSFGDGSSSAGGGTVSHRYTGSGTFDVWANITDSAGTSINVSGSVFVYPMLSSGISGGPFGPSIPPLTVGFDALPSGGSGPPYSYTWAFGDGTANGSGASTGHVYSLPGAYVVTLTTRDSTGASVTSSVNVTVVQPLVLRLAATTALSGEAPVTVNLTATTTYGLAPIQFSWTFGDGLSQHGGQVATHTYTVANTYRVTLVASDAAGDLVTRTLNVSVLLAAQPGAITATTFSTSCTPRDTVEAFSFTTLGGVAPYTGTWEFGDGNGWPAVNTTHTYDSNGTFEVTLTLVDSQGRTTTSFANVSVPGPLCYGTGVPPGHGGPGGPAASTPASVPLWIYGALLVVAIVGLSGAVVWVLRRDGR